MFTEALKHGFANELAKISEVNLSGIDAGTILNYPKPEPIPSAAYEKAKAILSRVQPVGAEKTARIRPDRMEPGYDALLGKKRKKKDGKTPTEQVKSFGAHVLGGAGAGKFLHDWVDSGRQTYGKSHPLPAGARSKFWAINAGALTGAAAWAHKRIKRHRAEQQA